MRQKIRIPPLPQITVLVDREDGTEWALSHEDDVGIMRVSINDATISGRLSGERQVRHHWDMGQGIRLFVRDGRLGFEVVEYDLRDAPPYTRDGIQRETHKIVVPNAWRSIADDLAFIEENALA